jgi:hypothetical protein
MSSMGFAIRKSLLEPVCYLAASIFFKHQRGREKCQSDASIFVDTEVVCHPTRSNMFRFTGEEVVHAG